MENKIPIIEFENVEIDNSEHLVLSDVNIKIYPGDFAYIIGRVGSGKTSIIRTLTGELPIHKGKCRIGEFQLDKLKKRQVPYLRRSIGVIFQDFQLLMDRTIFDNLKFVLNATGWKNKTQITNKINKVLNDVGMIRKAHKMPHQLSGGEQQRIAIARALLNDPQIILADEPTGNLDVDTASEIMDLIQKINRNLGLTIVMVTHNRTILQKYPGRVYICEDEKCTERVASPIIDLSELM